MTDLYMPLVLNQKLLIVIFPYYFILFTVIVMIILLIRYYMRRKNIPGELFAEALRNENSGHFEAAAVTYKDALHAVKRNRFNNNTLEKSINEKLKTLYTVIEYRKSFDFGSTLVI